MKFLFAFGLFIIASVASGNSAVPAIPAVDHDATRRPVAVEPKLTPLQFQTALIEDLKKHPLTEKLKSALDKLLITLMPTEKAKAELLDLQKAIVADTIEWKAAMYEQNRFSQEPDGADKVKAWRAQAQLVSARLTKDAQELERFIEAAAKKRFPKDDKGMYKMDDGTPFLIKIDGPRISVTYDGGAVADRKSPQLAYLDTRKLTKRAFPKNVRDSKVAVIPQLDADLSNPTYQLRTSGLLSYENGSIINMRQTNRQGGDKILDWQDIDQAILPPGVESFLQTLNLDPAKYRELGGIPSQAQDAKP